MILHQWETAMIDATDLFRSQAISPLGAAEAETAYDAGRPQPFGDFSAFESGARISLGQAGASADPAHAARAVAAFLLTD
jgi:hypothetical protein